jgi:hypothetical protein
MPFYVSQRGFRRGWRLKRVEHGYQKGTQGPKFLAVYEIQSIEDFVVALELAKEKEADNSSWTALVGKVRDLQRSYYSLRLAYRDREKENIDIGDCHWTIVKANFESTDSNAESEFNEWYNNIHVPEVCSFPGFHRAWRLEMVPHEKNSGFASHKYWAVYETDNVDYLQKAREGTTPWDGIWDNNIKDWSISFYNVLFQDLSGPAW